MLKNPIDIIIIAKGNITTGTEGQGQEVAVGTGKRGEEAEVAAETGTGNAISIETAGIEIAIMTVVIAIDRSGSKKKEEVEAGKAVKNSKF